MHYYPIQGGVTIFLITYCYRNRDKLRLDGPLRLVCRLYFTFHQKVQNNLTQKINQSEEEILILWICFLATNRGIFK